MYINRWMVHALMDGLDDGLMDHIDNGFFSKLIQKPVRDPRECNACDETFFVVNDD